eukprot:355985-Chlamydomonas_euryale.AAC.3
MVPRHPLDPTHPSIQHPLYLAPPALPFVAGAASEPPAAEMGSPSPRLQFGGGPDRPPRSPRPSEAAGARRARAPTTEEAAPARHPTTRHAAAANDVDTRPQRRPTGPPPPVGRHCLTTASRFQSTSGGPGCRARATGPGCARVERSARSAGARALSNSDAEQHGAAWRDPRYYLALLRPPPPRSPAAAGVAVVTYLGSRGRSMVRRHVGADLYLPLAPILALVGLRSPVLTSSLRATARCGCSSGTDRYHLASQPLRQRQPPAVPRPQKRHDPCTCTYFCPQRPARKQRPRQQLSSRTARPCPLSASHQI